MELLKILKIEKALGFVFLLFLFSSPKLILSQSNKWSSNPIKNNLNNTHSKTNLTKWLSEKEWNQFFPNRYGIKSPNKKFADFYAFKFFVAAAKLFPGFLSAGNEMLQKRELAAFLANIAQETSGGWDNAPGGYFKWGLCFLEENNKAGYNNYNDTSKKNYPGVAGKFYYGRGPKQLSWNYNYGQFSEAWYGEKDSLLLHPEYVATDPVLSFGSAIWFWMTAQFPKPSCHDIIIGKWIPNAADSLKGRLPGFGAVLNVINGGLECGLGKDLDKTSYRYQYYLYFCKYFNVSPGENIRCTNQMPFGR